MAPAFALGVMLLQWVPELPFVWTIPVILLLSALSLSRPAVARWLIPFVLGFLWAWLHAAWQLGQRLDPALEGRDLLVAGKIESLPERVDGKTRFLFRILALDGVEPSFGGRVRLNWYRDAPRLTSGERWRLKVRLKAPHGFANPGGFDYEGWLFREGIRATGYVRVDPQNRRLETAAPSLDRLRQRLRQELGRALDGFAAGGMVSALTLGDRSALDRRQWEVLTRTGTNHLIAISGLHVGIVAALVFFLFRHGWRLAAGLTRRLAADRAAALAAMIAAGGYAALAGFAVSTQRALIMLAVLFAALLLRRALRPSAGLSLALGVVLLFDPLASLSPGFWLSFAAVAALAYGMSGRAGQNGLGWRWGRAQWLVAVGLAPLLFLLFGKASVVAPVVNLIAVPVFSLLLLPWVLAGAVLLFAGDWALPLQGAAWVLEQGYSALQWLAGLSWAAWSLPDRPLWAWTSGFVAVAVLLAPRGLPGRWTGLLLLAPLGLLQAHTPPPGAFRFTLLDVGQGLAAVVQTEKHVLVYDTGPGFPSGFNTGGAVIAPFLRASGHSRADTLVVSHADIDHAGGVAGLLAEIPVDRVLAGEPDQIAAADVEQCLDGMSWRWDGVEFRVLHPQGSSTATGNNRSCVLQVRSPAGSLLLTGDAEKRVERELVARLGQALKSDVLVAGHHGSDTSTSKALLDRVRPDWVLFSAGYRNRYGFPKTTVVERVRRSGAHMADTVSGGALTMAFSPGGSLSPPNPYRLTHARYWSHKAAVLAAGDSGYDAFR